MIDKQQESKRKFIKISIGMLTGTLIATSGLFSIMAPARSWSLPLTALPDNVAETILIVTRHIFPHKNLEDAVYALVVKDLDNSAANDPAVKKLLIDGVATLNKKSTNNNWLSASYQEQNTIILSMVDSVFFEKIRGTSIVSLYNNEMAWAHFGYEGPSYEKGGYLNRGFQDLNWLPEPPHSTSPLKNKT
ncbi:hypothetical protein HWQ46_03920 [Shewanella sp. D64]|uniref:hypothetical protein n=1 Tax=unclassified Shewanella TaxID=196818 RepID=UPI0022BA3592|nr:MULTISPECIES: hypothetical protein [unclassified Shewanella]MEC4724693.1 hypothetical protein [Shewanella sp. D64]MEC4736513.1 hypothetical protein [Shewanella sp. E94]WBJ97434.1 hypothetical protein HWQ47_10295 [Shewanella sp. MTB7]